MYKRKEVRKLSGTERFTHAGGKEVSVLDFWRYGFSNLNSNVLRGALAEFLVENALKDREAITVRNPWGDSDVDDEGGTIEVKCCSYLQDWDQDNLSKVVFSGLKAKPLYWSSAVGAFPREPADYKSDIYVFALLDHQDPETLDILDLDQWRFWVLAKEDLRRITKNRNSVSLKRLEKAGVPSVGFSELAEKIREARSV